MPRRKAVKPSSQKLSDDDKRKLAQLVKDFTCIWRISDPNFRKHDANVAAWMDVSKAMGFSVSVCKEGWRSLKDGLRYHHASRKKPGKSGDPIDITEDMNEEFIANDFDEEQLNHWKFWDAMKFVMNEKPSRKTLSSMENEVLDEIADDKEDSEVINVTSTPSPKADLAATKSVEDPADAKDEPPEKPAVKRRLSTSNYDYQAKRLKKSVTKPVDEKIADSIQTLVSLRQASMDSAGSKVDESKSLMYYSMYANIDRMLQKLPESVVEDLNFEFQVLIRNEIKKLE